MKVVIIAKTRMGSGACIGALTFDGRSLRLVAEDRESNDQFNMEYQVGEVWEVKTHPDPEIIPPHVENVIVSEKRRLAPMSNLAQFVALQMPPLVGGREVIHEGLTQKSSAGALYIAERTGLPQRSAFFWQPEQDLILDTRAKQICYRHPDEDGGFTLTFTGFQQPVERILAGSLLRVSLAHWWRPDEMPEGELRCYVQLSGWIDSGRAEAFWQPPSQNPGAIRANLLNTENTEFTEKFPKKEAVDSSSIQKILKEKFGYDEFRPLQRKIIENVLKRRDSLAVMPTGSGKSLCYQLPATLFEGLTLVVSPLISLMEDQVLELREWGIPSLYLNSTLSHAEYLDAVRRVRSGEIKLLYGAPETLLRPETKHLLAQSNVELIVIDEAHCISAWGHDFRPEYRQLNELRRHLPQAATLALTATATERVRADIKKTLGISAANEFIGSFDRPNLVLSVADKVAGLAQVRDFLQAHPKQAGIIYCNTRDQVAALAEQLQREGFPALPYHAGMDSGTRRAHQRRFRYEENLIIVATIAFGMGINKSNVRFIIHYDLPKNIESYYQQIGRAGRDGLPADCLLLFSYSDVRTIRYFISQGAADQKKGAEMRLDALLRFVDTHRCRRIPLLDYFGEKYTQENCQACDHCLDEKTDRSPGEPATVKENLTQPAQLFVKCALDTEQIFGAAHLINVLRGSRAQKLLKFGHDKVPSYGQGKQFSKEYWQHLATQFVRLDLLKRTQPHGSLVVTEKGREVLNGKEIWGNIPGEFTKAAQGKVEYDAALFEKLRDLRSELAKGRNLPPYVIFHDSALAEMATYFPQTESALRQMRGVGGKKVAEYAKFVLPLIQAYCRENNIQPVTKRKGGRKRLSSRTGQQRTHYIWEQFQAGKSIDQIATDMGFRPATILKHLQNAKNDGREISIENLKKSSKLTPEEGQRVLDAIAEQGSEYLRPIFDALNEEISYEEIRLWKMIFEIEGI